MLTMDYHPSSRNQSTSLGNLRKTSRSPSLACVIDLCSGMGGLSLAASQLGMKIVAGVDLNKDAILTFEKNFSGAQAILGDVRSKRVLDSCINSSKQHPGPLVIVSGPPCQGFSAAGPRNPADPRNQVLLDVARSVVKLKPDCALLENVSMVLSDAHRSRLSKLERIFKNGGYFVQKVLLDAADFGVAQRRKRAFFLISKFELNEEEVLERLEKQKRPQQNAAAALKGLPKPRVRPEDYDDLADCKGIPNHFSMRHSKHVMDKIARLEPGTGPMSYRRLHPKRPSNTLFSGHRAPPAHFSEPRSITVREAARLQGFPDSFRIYGSFGNQMTQVTNAVPPPLAQVVLRVLADLTGVPVL